MNNLFSNILNSLILCFSIFEMHGQNVNVFCIANLSGYVKEFSITNPVQNTNLIEKAHAKDSNSFLNINFNISLYYTDSLKITNSDSIILCVQRTEKMNIIYIDIFNVKNGDTLLIEKDGHRGYLIISDLFNNQCLYEDKILNILDNIPIPSKMCKTFFYHCCPMEYLENDYD